MELLSQEHQYQDALQKYVAYVNHLTQVIPVWAKITSLPSGTLEISQIPTEREAGWICLTATGLNLIGRIGHSIFSRGEKDWHKCTDKLSTWTEI
jgi:hypothetical protein